MHHAPRRSAHPLVMTHSPTAQTEPAWRYAGDWRMSATISRASVEPREVPQGERAVDERVKGAGAAAPDDNDKLKRPPAAQRYNDV